MANRVDPHRPVYSFALNQNEPPPVPVGQKAERTPLSEAQLIHLSHNTPLPVVPPPPLGVFPGPADLPSTPRLTYGQMLDEIGRLEEVIYFLNKDKAELKDQGDSLQKHLTDLREASNKEKELLNAEIRKLKQQIMDKEFECEKIGKTSRKEKEMLEKENERITNHVKTLIEKRTNDIFELEREKLAAYQNMKRELESRIDDEKTFQKRESSELGSKLEQAREETYKWKQKYKDLQDQMDALDRRYQDSKLRIIEEHENNMGQLKHKYHRTKMLLIETGMQEAKSFEESANIQKEVFLLEIDELKATIERHQKEEEQLREQVLQKQKNWARKVSELHDLIAELEEKLKIVHQKKQQQLEISKIKASEFHQRQLQSVEKVYAVKVSTLEKKVTDRDEAIKRLQQHLSKEISRNKDLINEIHQKEHDLTEQLSKMRIDHANAQQAIRDQYETQKGIVSEQSTYTVKLLESKISQINIKDKEIEELRKLYEQKGRAYDRLEELVDQERKQIAEERALVKKQAAQANDHWKEEEVVLKRAVEDKAAQVAKLNDELNRVLEEQSQPDFSKYEEQISSLSQKLRDLSASEKDWRQKQHRLEQRVQQVQQDSQKNNKDVLVIIEEAKKEWQQHKSERQDQLQKIHNRKVANLQMEREQLKSQCTEAQAKADNMALKYIEMQAALKEALDTMRRRTDLQAKVIELGMDENLVRNKQELFEY